MRFTAIFAAIPAFSGATGVSFAYGQQGLGEAVRAVRAEVRLDRMLARIGLNGDGRTRSDEVDELGARRFARLDLNEVGRVERDAFRHRRSQRRSKGNDGRAED